MDILTFLLVGFLAGLIVVSWQCFKDPPWEGFSLIKFARTFIFSGLVALVFYFLISSDLVYPVNFGILLLTIICFERALGEVYKGFFKKKHEEYNEVFTHYNLGLQYKSAKVFLGVGLSVLITLLFILFAYLPDLLLPLINNKYVLGGILGLIAGVTVAAGGALKDTTFEEFNPRKFLRSPIAGLIGGLILVNFMQEYRLLIFACIGFERVVCECYKTFIRRRVRGIFEHKKVRFPMWMRLRWLFVHTYAFGVYWLVLYLFS
jgi:hypothetical protein